MTVGTSGPHRARAVGKIMATALAAMVVLAGCTKPTTYEGWAKEAQKYAPNQRPWFCNSVGQGTPPSGHGNGSHVHPFYEGKTKAPLSWDDCLKLAAQLDQTMQAVKGLETKAKGEAAGWREVASYIPGLGTHHAKVPGGGTTPGSTPGSTPGTAPGGGNVETIRACLKEKGFDTTAGGIPPDFTDPAFMDALKACGVQLPPPGSVPGGVGTTFDPAKPPLLIYGGPQPDAPLVGVAYTFFGGDTPPEAYAGGNDWWHLHTRVCIGPKGDVLAGAEEVTDEQCTAMGGKNRNLGGFPGTSAGPNSGIWLLHVWLVPPYEYRPDIFVSGHPCLSATGALPQSDPCWKDAHRDPSTVTPPTTVAGGGPGHGGDDHGGAMPPAGGDHGGTMPPGEDHGGDDHG
jgi:hypothetical protein